MNLETISLDDLSRQIQDLDQEALLSQTEALVKRERELTAKTLVLFREIETRMIHLEMGFKSLFDMLVHHFSLSEGCASRRVASVRLMSEVPEIEKKISNGELSLSNVAAAQRFFNVEAKNQKPLGLEEKKQILETLVGRSVREAEKELMQRSSLPISLQIPDQVKPKGDDHVEIRFLAPQSLADLLDEAKGLLAHRLPQGAKMADLIEALTVMSVERIKKERFGIKGNSIRQKPHPIQDEIKEVEIDTPPQMNEKREAQEKGNIGADVLNSLNPVEAKERSRHIPLSVRREVYTRAGGKCEYQDEKTGRRCNSSLFLELDHQIAFAKGGQHLTEGIILACRYHNEWRAQKDFGPIWMSQFKNKGVPRV